jgi:hypothetical protein|tara:strand:+ start:423 stop:605 length:183 start_codon:yes stop_codon:yes gene_type:complete
MNDKLVKLELVDSKAFSDFLKVYSRPLVYKNKEWYVPLFFVNKFNGISKDNTDRVELLPF